MIRTNLIRFLRPVGRRWVRISAFLMLGLAACATPKVTELSEQAPSIEQKPVAEGDGVSQREEAELAPLKKDNKAVTDPDDEDSDELIPASDAPKPVTPKKVKKKKKRARRASVEDRSSVNEENSNEIAETGVAAGDIAVKCIVRLPDDETDHPELCRDFRILVLDEAGAEVTRFRFDGDGFQRFQAEAGKKYRLKPLIGSNWKFVVEPGRSLKEGEQARVVFTQKQ